MLLFTHIQLVRTNLNSCFMKKYKWRMRQLSIDPLRKGFGAIGVVRISALIHYIFKETEKKEIENKPRFAINFFL